MDIDYLNARVRGLKGSLFTRSYYDRLIGIEGDAGEVVAELSATLYGPQIIVAEAALDEPLPILRRALRKNIASTFATVWKAAPDGLRASLKAVFTIWEAYNLKTVIRGLVNNMKREEILAMLIPAGEMDIPALRELSWAKNPKDLLAILETWGSPYGGPVREAMGVFHRTGKLLQMELALDRLSIDILHGAAAGRLNGRVFREMLSFRADGTNVMTLLKTQSESYGPREMESFFVEGGRVVDMKLYKKLSEVDGSESLLEALIEYTGAWGALLFDLDDEEVWLFEDRLEHLMLSRLLRLSIVEPSSIALAVWYLFNKAREVRNLRLIAGAKSFHIPGEEVKRMIFFPGQTHGLA